MKKNKGSQMIDLVGPVRFELTTTCTPSTDPTKLDYGPAAY